MVKQLGQVESGCIRLDGKINTSPIAVRARRRALKRNVPSQISTPTPGVRSTSAG